MALWQMKNTRLMALMAGTALALSAGADARADFPGERWSVGYVQVEGADPSVSSAASLGLTRANQTYFYGDRNTRMDARLRGAVFDVRIIDPATGQVIAKQTDLPYDPGDVSASIAASALAWMDSLGCVDGCNLAESGAAPAPVQVAAAPAPQPDPVPAPTPVADPDPEPVEPQPVEPQPVEPQPTVADPDPAPEDALQLALPDPEPDATAPSTAEILAIVSTPSLVPQAEQSVQSPSPSLVLSEAPRGDAVQLSQPGVTATAPSPGAPDSAVQGLDADLVLAEAEKTNAADLGTPSVGSAPASAAGSGRSAEVRLPGTPAAPVTAAPAASSDPLVIAAAPAASAGESSAPRVSAPAPTPATPAISVPAQPAAEASATVPAVETSNETALQEVAPGVNLPEPGSQAATALLPASEDTAPRAENASDRAPETGTAPAVAAPVPAAVETPVLGNPATPAPRATTTEETAVVAAAPTVEPPSVEAPAVATAATPEPATPSVEAPAVAAVATPEPATPSVEDAPATPAPIAEDPAPAAPSVETATASPAPSEDVTAEDLNGEQLALANPAAPVTPQPGAEQPVVPQQEVEAVSPQIVQPQAQTETQAADEGTQVETQVAAVDPEATGPTLANARWVGFTPAVFTGSDTRSGVWISGPFDRKERTGWITDTATGATARVRFVWREGGSGGRTAILSREAARALGLGQGDVANVAVYLPR